LRTVCGVNPVKEALRANPGRIREVVLLGQSRVSRELAPVCERAGVRWRPATRDELDRLAPGAVHQGAVATVSDFQYLELDELIERSRAHGRPPLLLLLDGIEDPHNLGAIVRSAQVLSADGLILPKDRATGVTPVVAKASAGAIETAQIAQVTNLSRCLETLKEEGFWAAAADQKAKSVIWDIDFTVPLVLVIGAEGKGVRPLVRSHCDLVFRIPIEGSVGSLNASVAAGIALYEIARQRQKLA
jgi:23S rRNA (guanosine2251-2'-O)-methyltransferase